MHTTRQRIRKASVGTLFALSLLVVSGCAPSGHAGPPSPADPPAPSDDPSASGSNAEQSAADCVLGSWQVDKGSEMWLLWADDEDNVVTGNIFVHFTDVDFYGIEYDNVVIKSDIVGEIGYTVETVWSGISSGFYEVHDDGTVTTDVTPEATVTSTQNTPAGTEVSENAVGNPFPLFYTCEGDRILGHAQEDPSSVVVAFDRMD